MATNSVFGSKSLKYIKRQGEDLKSYFGPVDEKSKDNLERRAWANQPEYFTKVKISVLAVLKMFSHANQHGKHEVMGMLFGRVLGSTMVITDSFAAPVEGTETRVNAQAESYEFIASYTNLAQTAGRRDNIIGWYHSHPDFGCWLSGIDVSTQAINQQYQEPFVAVVVDHIRTAASGKLHIGAFRTYPKNTPNVKHKDLAVEGIPKEKLDDFGYHHQKYYSLEVSYFCSPLDQIMLNSMQHQCLSQLMNVVEDIQVNSTSTPTSQKATLRPSGEVISLMTRAVLLQGVAPSIARDEPQQD